MGYDNYDDDYDNRKKKPFYKRYETSIKISSTVLAGLGATGVVAFLWYRFHIAQPNQVLVKMGLGVPNGISHGTRMYQFPFQRVQSIDMRPRNLPFNLHSMSTEKIEFLLPCSYTVGPYPPEENSEAFTNFARRLYNAPDEHIISLVKGIVEGETRILTANMTVEELFSSKDRFKDMVVDRVQEDLQQFGLKVYNANIQELRDLDDNNRYFDFRKQRAVEAANNEAQVDVARARKEGQVGVKKNETEARAQTALQETIAKLAENEQEQKIIESNTSLAVYRAENDRRQKEAQYLSEVSAEQRRTELMQELAKKQQEQLLEQLRATDLTKTAVLAEQQIKEASGQAEAIRLIAEANLYKAMKEAEGIRCNLEAQASGLQQIIASSNNDPDLAKFYLAKDTLLPQLARSQADAVREMKPNVNIWNTGANAETSELTRFVQNMAPLASGLFDQTGLKNIFNRTPSRDLTPPPN